MALKRRFTAIDIGTDSIKGVRFKRKSKGLFIDKVAVKHLPYDSIIDGTIVDDAVVSNRLNELVQELKCRKDKIITTIPNNNLIIRNMELPEMEDDNRLAEAIKWESEDHLPFPVESAVEDFKILSREDNRVQVLLVATKRDVIDNVMNVFERISIIPSVINIQPMALLSIADYQDLIEDTVAIIDIGAAGTRVVIGDRRNIYLSRNIDIGGNEFTRIIMEEDKLNYNEAENIKKRNGLPEEDEIGENFELAISQIATTGLGESHSLLVLARNLADQIERSLDYYNVKYRKKVDKIFISGGGAKLKRLKNIIEDRIGRDMFSLDPFINIGCKKGIDLRAEELAVAIGLGISEVLPDEG
ncbi:MAG: type IV pilus assembly protein PilM [Halanaerobiales bacterium]